MFRHLKLLPVLLLSLVCLPCGAQPVASAETGYQQLDRFLRDLKGLQAEFAQTLQDSRGQLVQKSSGTLEIKRPNQFRWEYREPSPQLIVCDGQRLWLYDEDLEQVTVRRFEQTLAGTPAMLLSGTEDLRNSFEVERVEERDGWSWISLTPKRADTDFKRVRLGLRKDQLGYMELHDKLGQITLLQFSKFKRNPPPAPGRFEFKPPPGVDVIGAAASK